jgi:hypothetical protein
MFYDFDKLRKFTRVATLARAIFFGYHYTFPIHILFVPQVQWSNIALHQLRPGLTVLEANLINHLRHRLDGVGKTELRSESSACG